jgi:hypothetical protein
VCFAPGVVDALAAGWTGWLVAPGELSVVMGTGLGAEATVTPPSELLLGAVDGLTPPGL